MLPAAKSLEEWFSGCFHQFRQDAIESRIFWRHIFRHPPPTLNVRSFLVCSAILFESNLSVTGLAWREHIEGCYDHSFYLAVLLLSVFRVSFFLRWSLFGLIDILPMFFCKSKYCKLTFSRNAAICWSKYCYCLSGHLNLTLFFVIFLRADVLWEKLQIKSALLCITHKKVTNSFLFCGCMTYSRASTLDGSGRAPSAPYVIPQNEIVLQPNWHVLWFKVRRSLDMGCIASSITFIFTL